MFRVPNCPTTDGPTWHKSNTSPECLNSSHTAALVLVKIVSLLIIITFGTSTVLPTLYLLRHRELYSSKDSLNDQKKSVSYSARDVECKIEAYDGTACKNFKGERVMQTIRILH